MLKSIFTPVSGALTQERVLEVLSNNLANMNTVGFKGDAVSFEVLLPEPNKHYKDPLPPANYKVDLDSLSPLKGNEVSYVGVSEIKRDMTQGSAVITHNPTDVMLEGNGMFTVNTPDGIRYTRNGSFSLNADGVLMTKSGHPVLGNKGTISVRSGQFEINPRGEIYQDGQLIDTLQITDFADPKALERVGDNYFFFGGKPEDAFISQDHTMKQGMLESSNVNAIKNLTAMIMAHRSYEAYQKAVSNFDSMMEKSSNVIGEIRA